MTEMAEKHCFFTKIAELTIRIDCTDPYVRDLCDDYIVHPPRDIDILAEATETDVRQEMEEGVTHHSYGYCESVCIYRSIAEQLPTFDGFVIHGAAIEIDGKGYIFIAPSGTGKSTHISMLMKLIPERIKIVNGDKPIIRRIKGRFYVCSTPWAGKEGWQRNAIVPLNGICILRRAEKNTIQKVNPSDYFDDIIRQIYLPVNNDTLIKTLDLVNDMSICADFLLLHCNTAPDAPEVSLSMILQTDND